MAMVWCPPSHVSLASVCFLVCLRPDLQQRAVVWMGVAPPSLWRQARCCRSGSVEEAGAAGGASHPANAAPSRKVRQPGCGPPAFQPIRERRRTRCRIVSQSFFGIFEAQALPEDRVQSVPSSSLGVLPLPVARCLRVGRRSLTALGLPPMRSADRAGECAVSAVSPEGRSCRALRIAPVPPP
jgi:hypothetical protein